MVKEAHNRERVKECERKIKDKKSQKTSDE